MDKFQPQTPGIFVKEGHREIDFNLRGIILFIVILVLSAIFTFLIAWGMLRGLEWWERTHEAKATPVQQQLEQERGGEPIERGGGVKPPSDWYTRARDEKVINNIFATPRLQYDDVRDMNLFRDSENERLNNVGKNPDGSVHIPIADAIDYLSRSKLPEVNGTFRVQPPLAVPTGESRPSTHTEKSQRGMRGDVSH
jgi:hypothetical protein